MNSPAMVAFSFGHLLVAIQTSPRRSHLEARKEEKEEALFFSNYQKKKHSKVLTQKKV